MVDAAHVSIDPSSPRTPTCLHACYAYLPLNTSTLKPHFTFNHPNITQHLTLYYVPCNLWAVEKKVGTISPTTALLHFPFTGLTLRYVYSCPGHFRKRQVWNHSCNDILPRYLNNQFFKFYKGGRGFD